MREIIRKIDILISKYPFLSSIIFWVFGSFVTVALIFQNLYLLLNYQIKFFHLLVTIIIIISIFFIFKRFLWLRTFSKNLLPRIGLLFLFLSILTVLIIKLSTPKVYLQIDITDIKIPHISTANMQGFGSRMLLTKILKDAMQIQELFPDIVSKSNDELVEIYNNLKKQVNKRTETYLKNPSAAISIKLSNVSKRKLTIYKAELRMRLGEKTKFYGDREVTTSNNKIKFSNNYRKTFTTAWYGPLRMDPPNFILEYGNAGSDLTLYYDDSDAILKYPEIYRSLSYQLRYRDMFQWFSDDYLFLLGVIYEQYTKNNEYLEPARKLMIEDLLVAGCEVEILLYHNYGISKHQESCLIGVLDLENILEIFWPLKQDPSMEGLIDEISIYDKNEELLFKTQKNKHLIKGK